MKSPKTKDYLKKHKLASFNCSFTSFDMDSFEKDLKKYVKHKNSQKINCDLSGVGVRYRMCDDQLAQIDCRDDSCRYHIGSSCKNISPAITLNSGGKWVCWSKSADS